MEELLKQLGLAPGEAAVYQALLERESGSPAELAQLTKLKRPDTYNKLAELRAKGLVEEFTAPNGRKRYRLEHPQKLQDYLSQREQALHTVERQLDSALPDLVSRYQLAGNKPGVSYFEGKDGIRRVLEATLTATTIDQFLDTEAVHRYIPDLNAEFGRKRDKLGITKRIIMIDTPAIRAHVAKQHRPTLDIRLAQFSHTPFNTSLSIYGDTVSFMTLKPAAMVGVLIHDPTIANMQRGVFEFVWNRLAPFEPPTA